MKLTATQKSDRSTAMPLPIDGATKERVRAIILRVIEETAASRGIGWRSLLDDERGSPSVASARVLAMAVCCAAGIPMQIVGRAFNRKWQTVDSARQRQTALCVEDPTQTDEFIRILYRAFQP